ncbi:NADH dehydrogenase [ubiquinone] 1 beta subcomplex subunit 11, mitochondrial [Apteryx mantelli]|uniref:NADH dehydrogenase [ubiquinone] 1 beta subcomplex subunit 11, mitochondrial n=1 Tax=Apteryx mantelli TaxID=2696672 RepID=A0ABM4G1Y7_9AVES
MAALAGCGRALRALRVAAAAAGRGPGSGSGVRRRSAAAGTVSPAPPSAAAAAARHRHAEEEEEGLWAMQRKHPDTHGFSEDPAADVLNMRGAFVAGVSVAIVLGSVFLHYLPDYGLREWARREAERQIRTREAQGLPLVTPDYYDPARLPLPPPARPDPDAWAPFPGRLGPFPRTPGPFPRMPGSLPRTPGP